ncbi:hypothetical protein LXL04_038243 [Taraxacum kok-saghyz]
MPLGTWPSWSGLLEQRRRGRGWSDQRKFHPYSIQLEYLSSLELYTRSVPATFLEVLTSYNSAELSKHVISIKVLFAFKARRLLEVDFFGKFTMKKSFLYIHLIYGEVHLGILSFHLVLAFLGELWSVLSTPSYFHNGNPTLLQSFDFPIHDLHRFFHKVEFLINLDLFQGNNERFLRQAFLEVSCTFCSSCGSFIFLTLLFMTSTDSSMKFRIFVDLIFVYGNDKGLIWETLPQFRNVENVMHATEFGR